MTSRYRLISGSLAVVIALSTATWVYQEGRVHRVTVAAGPADGESFELARAIALVAERHVPDLDVVVLETSGSAQNNTLLEDGSVDLAMSQANIAPASTARLVAPLYPDAFQLVAREGAGIEGVADLRGKKVAIPSSGSGQNESFWFLMAHYGLDETRVDALPMSSEAANFAMLSEGVDAVFRVRAPGNDAVRDLIAHSPSHIVPIGQAAAMRLRSPSLESGTIPEGAYRGTPPLPPADLPTATVMRLLVAHVDLAPAVTTALTRLLFERRRELVVQTPLAGFITAPDPSLGTFIPVHPGAQRYYARDEPSFFQENAEPIALVLSLVVLLGSGLLQLTRQGRKRRVDRYNNEALVLYSDSRDLTDPDALRSRRELLMDILGQVVDDAEEGRVTNEGFRLFSVTFGAVNEALRDRIADLTWEERFRD